MKKTKFTVTLIDKNLEIALASGAVLQLLEQNHPRFTLQKDELFLLLKKGQVKMIGADLASIPQLEFDRILIINSAAYDLEVLYLCQFLTNLAQENGITLRETTDSVKIPKNIVGVCSRAAEEFLPVLSAFGIKFEKKKIVLPKAQHRWKKALADVEFFVDYQGSKATVIWQKSNQLVIKAGAKMLENGGMKADGTPGLAYRFTQSLREEQLENWDAKTFVTTSDIILKSVNEVGHFLYFAGTNSWLVLTDADGRSLHERSVV